MTRSALLAAASITCLVTLGGCSNKANEPVKLGAPPAAAPAAAPAVTPGAPAQPQPIPEGAPAPTVTGTVVETMDVIDYTYVRVKGDNGEIWAATRKFPVAVGDRVVVPLETPMKDWHSDRLKRDFPLIYFASRIAKEGEPAATPPPMAAAHGQAGPGRQGAMPGAQVIEKIDPVPGGSTVADVWARRAALAGKTVTVRGKVVKFNGAIMGKNWIHLQDGTGSLKDGTHDLTVTSTDEVQVGDVVTVTGKLGVDRNFGAGYAYPVLLEDAKVVVK